MLSFVCFFLPRFLTKQAVYVSFPWLPLLCFDSSFYFLIFFHYSTNNMIFLQPRSQGFLPFWYKAWDVRPGTRLDFPAYIWLYYLYKYYYPGHRSFFTMLNICLYVWPFPHIWYFYHIVPYQHHLSQNWLFSVILNRGHKATFIKAKKKTCFEIWANLVPRTT